MDAPMRFDSNEWYAIVTTLSMILLMAVLPRRMPPVVSVMIFMFGLTMARLADHIFGAKGPFDYYDVVDSGKFEWMDLLTYPLYGMAAYLYIYLYNVLGLRGFRKKAGYVLVWSLFGVGYEHIAVLFHFFTYKNWNYYESFLVYAITQPATLLLYHFMLKTVKVAK